MTLKIVAYLGILISAPAFTQDASPFLTTNQNPFISIYGLPTLHSVRLVHKGQLGTDYVLDITNNSFEDKSAQESMVIDGETYRFSLYMKYGLSNDKELGIIVPFISHTAGFWDGFIKEWHDLFGLTNSRRDKWPNNSLLYKYIDQGVTKYNISDSTNGIGDVRVYGALRSRNDNSNYSRQVTFYTEIKLPTGNESLLRGSGSADLSVGINLVDDALFSQWKASLYGAIGIMVIGENDLLANRQRDSVSFGHIGMGWRVTERFYLKAQLDMHTSFYDSDITMLGSDSLQGILGGSLQLGEKTVLDVGVVENISTDSTPDVVLHVAVKNYR